MFLLLLTLTLGVAGAENLFYEVQQQELEPPSDGLLCPDQNSRCPYTASCCQLSSGKWGCCPFASATCCGDNIHCCPNGYTCNKGKEQCVRAINNNTISWANKEEAAAVGEPASSEEAMSDDEEMMYNPVERVWCDSRYYCQTGQTCCRRSFGKWGCCPFTGGTCCKKGKTCCPPGKRCSNPPGRCY